MAMQSAPKDAMYLEISSVNDRKQSGAVTSNNNQTVSY